MRREGSVSGLGRGVGAVPASLAGCVLGSPTECPPSTAAVPPSHTDNPPEVSSLLLSVSFLKILNCFGFSILFICRFICTHHIMDMFILLIHRFFFPTFSTPSPTAASPDQGAKSQRFRTWNVVHTRPGHVTQHALKAPLTAEGPATALGLSPGRCARVQIEGTFRTPNVAP